MIICRSCRISIDRRRLLSNKSTTEPSTSNNVTQAKTSGNKLSSFASASSSAAAAKEALVSKLSNFTSQASQLAKSKANDAVTNASDTIRTTLHNTKVNAKVKSEQYAWEAQRSINKVTKEMETKVKLKAIETKDKVKQSVTVATLSTKERIKGEFSKRMEHVKLPSSLLGGGKNNSTGKSVVTQTVTKSTPTASQESTTLKDAIPKDDNNLSSPQTKTSILSSLLPNKESIFSSASSSLISNTVANTTANLSTRIQNTIHKTFKWLWLWGLAAVGVYGITSTLTKEGMKILKDIVGGAVVGDGASDDKKSSSSYATPNGDISVAKGDANAVLIGSDNVNGGLGVLESSSSNNADDDRSRGGYYLSWLSSLGRGWK